MGTRVVALAHDAQQYELVRKIGRAEHTGAPARSAPSDNIDLIIDFSSDEGTKKAVDIALKHRAALLVATTGLSKHTLEALQRCAAQCPVMLAPNTSRSMAVLLHLVAEAARLLHGHMDVDILEQHHSAKKDRPSGTARRLAEVVATSAQSPFPGERVHSVRAGGIIGRHTVQFTDPGEMLELNHTVMNRDVFAAGALRAGQWLVQQPPGLYRVEQAWGLHTTDAAASGLPV